MGASIPWWQLLEYRTMLLPIPIPSIYYMGNFFQLSFILFLRETIAVTIKALVCSIMKFYMFFL